MNKFLNNVFKWDVKELVMDTVGVMLFSIAFNLFIEPNNLYSGGVLGLAQLLNNLVNHFFSLNINLTSLIYFSINIPLFVLAFFKISKSFCTRTMYTIIVQTLVFLIVPIPSKPLVPEMITNVFIGGSLVGVGCALILSSTGSTGGTDIVGIVLSNKYPSFSVGKNALCFNTLVFGASGIVYGLSTMIYSVLYSLIENLTIDRLHEQNISSVATIFTKKKPTKLLNFIKNDLNRGATWWKGTGEYENTDTYITYVALSRYELHKLENYIKKSGEDAFVVKNEYVGVKGNFDKRLSK
jgi:uncharacterized membrane-anchored protein YitT (DUF2179 family)